MKALVSYVGWTLVVVVVLLAMVHVMSPTVNPDQEVPPRHMPGPCWACHIVSGSAEMVDATVMP